MPVDWIHAGPIFMAAFLASSVECIEALTVVLAVGTVRGWRSALQGAVAGICTLLLVVVVLGPALTLIPLDAMRIVVGALLLLFGLRWLQKAILRSAGIVALRDEASVYKRQQDALRNLSPDNGRVDAIAFATAFKSVILEGTEVAFIVVALTAGHRGLLWPAGAGAFAALAATIVLGICVHRPLARIPENMLKFVVGVLLSAFGTFWAGEGMGVEWFGHEWAILGLIAGYLAIAITIIPICRRMVGQPAPRLNRP